MNDQDERAIDSFRSFLLMSELEQDSSLSQRELAKRLGIALGLVNSYLKNLASLGYLRVKSFPRNRYAYLLTPKGMAEKSRLAYQHLAYFNNLYRVARQDYTDLFKRLKAEGVTRVAFCGVDEATEIAYLSLRETSIELATVMDDDRSGSQFFDKTVVSLAMGLLSGNYRIVITSFKKGEALRARLLQMGIETASIHIAESGETPAPRSSGNSGGAP
ncbi:MAG TPA: winged helix-turn-helix transcriptional regulator [Geobacterales bacterium]|nr:winged helix-turn-helix transcriptional regulator [Geobacterales bacterium]